MMEIIKSIAMFSIFGKPIVVYGGILTLCLFLFTAYISISNRKGDHRIGFAWHSKMAIVALIVACIHAIFAFSLFW
jgi:hypothetical protein